MIQRNFSSAKGTEETPDLQDNRCELQPGDEDPTVTDACLKHVVTDAVEHGLPEELLGELKDLLREFRNIFRTKLGCDEPARLLPLVVRLKPDTKPIRAKVRRYSPAQLHFMRQKTDQYLRLGLIQRNEQSSWACAPLIVPKPGNDKFSFTVDLRPLNQKTMPHAWPMPNLENSLAGLSSSTCYAQLDFCQGFWQLPLAPESQELCSFITPDGVFSPTRVLQGLSNAATHFQSAIQSIYAQT